MINPLEIEEKLNIKGPYENLIQFPKLEPVSMQANPILEAKKEAEKATALAKRSLKEERRYMRYMKGQGK